MNRDFVKEFVTAHKEEAFKLLFDLCAIPAPSHFERARAEYCKKWLESVGAEGVYIDSADNVIFPCGCEGKNSITVLAAHLDTVFPDREPMPYYDDGERIHSPGVADDTASAVVLLLCAKYFVEHSPECKNGIMFVFNSCEEGLGDLKGMRRLFSDMGDRIGRFITFDSQLDIVCDRCVGSHRYEVKVTTEGGHSFGNFGRKNAIAVLSEIVGEIYKLEVPKKEGTRTTYNVGTVSGGTSVNTIAQSACMLCEYRSDDLECLEYMKERFDRIFERAREDGVGIKVTRVGDRPCGNTEANKIEELESTVIPVIERIIEKKVSRTSGSTDCNIPMSLGIPSLCVGVNTYHGIHTREEWVNKRSILTGLEIAISLALALA